MVRLLIYNNKVLTIRTVNGLIKPACLPIFGYTVPPTPPPTPPTPPTFYIKGSFNESLPISDWQFTPSSSSDIYVLQKSFILTGTFFITESPAGLNYASPNYTIEQDIYKYHTITAGELHTPLPLIADGYKFIAETPINVNQITFNKTDLTLTIDGTMEDLPDGPYILASTTAYLNASAADHIYYASTPQVLKDTLSRQTVGQNPFEFSFSVHSSSIGAGTVYLLELPGLLNVKSEDNTLMFKFGWLDGWRAVPSSVLVDGWNEVTLTGDGLSEIKLTINTSQFTIFGTIPFPNPIHFPVETEADQAVLNEILSSTTWEQTSTDIRNVKVSDSSGTAYTHFTYTPGKDCAIYVKASISSENNYDYGGVYVGPSVYEATQAQIKAKTVSSAGGFWLFSGSGSTLTAGTGVEVVDEYFTAPLTGGTTYVVSFCYAKDGSGSSGDDALKISEFFTGTSAEPYPAITTGQLDVKNNWLKVKNVNAILVGVTPDPDPEPGPGPDPEPGPDTPKEWYPSTGTGGSVWTPDDVVKPNDPVYDTEGNATTNDGSTGKVDTVVSVRPGGNGFTGSSGTDYTDTYTPPGPPVPQYINVIGTYCDPKYNSEGVKVYPEPNPKFGFVLGNENGDFLSTDVYYDVGLSNHIGTYNANGIFTSDQYVIGQSSGEKEYFTSLNGLLDTAVLSKMITISEQSGLGIIGTTHLWKPNKDSISADEYENLSAVYKEALEGNIYTPDKMQGYGIFNPQLAYTMPFINSTFAFYSEEYVNPDKDIGKIIQMSETEAPFLRIADIRSDGVHNVDIEIEYVGKVMFQS